MKTQKIIKTIGLLIITTALVFSLSGCGKSEPEKFGSEIVNRQTTSLTDILKEPVSFEGKTVTIEGEILRECPTGCWFEVQQDTGILYVDIHPAGLAIPQKVGSKVTVEGTVAMNGPQPILNGTGVEIK